MHLGNAVLLCLLFLEGNTIYSGDLYNLSSYFVMRAIAIGCKNYKQNHQ